MVSKVDILKNIPRERFCCQIPTTTPTVTLVEILYDVGGTGHG